MVFQGHQHNIAGRQPSLAQGNLDVEAKLADGGAVEAGNAQHFSHDLRPVAKKTVAGGDDDQFRSRVGAHVSGPNLHGVLNKPQGQGLFNEESKDQQIEEDGTDAGQDYGSHGFHG